MGYLYEAIAMRERYRRNSKSWKPHLDNSRAFILSTAENTIKKRKAVIIGSGLLLDVPMDELSEMFEEVILADIVHLPEAVKKSEKYRNVKILWHDIMGISEKIYNLPVDSDHKKPSLETEISRQENEDPKNRNREILLPDPCPSLPHGCHDADLVVSLNVLSQLAVVPCIYVLKKFNNIEDQNRNHEQEKVLERWCRKITESHISWLGSLNTSSVCLISDYSFRISDKNGVIKEQGSTIHDFMLPEPEKKWTWDIAPYGEEKSGVSKTLDAGGWSRSGFYKKQCGLFQ
jgi:hypothetical protein